MARVRSRVWHREWAQCEQEIASVFDDTRGVRRVVLRRCVFPRCPFSVSRCPFSVSVGRLTARVCSLFRVLFLSCVVVVLLLYFFLLPFVLFLSFVVVVFFVVFFLCFPLPLLFGKLFCFSLFLSFIFFSSPSRSCSKTPAHTHPGRAERTAGEAVVGHTRRGVPGRARRNAKSARRDFEKIQLRTIAGPDSGGGGVVSVLLVLLVGCPPQQWPAAAGAAGKEWGIGMYLGMCLEQLLAQHRLLFLLFFCLCFCLCFGLFVHCFGLWHFVVLSLLLLLHHLPRLGRPVSIAGRARFERHRVGGGGGGKVVVDGGGFHLCTAKTPPRRQRARHSRRSPRSRPLRNEHGRLDGHRRRTRSVVDP